MFPMTEIDELQCLHLQRFINVKLTETELRFNLILQEKQNLINLQHILPLESPHQIFKNFPNPKDIVSLMKSKNNYTFDENEKSITLKWRIVADQFTRNQSLSIELEEKIMDEKELLGWQKKILLKKIEDQNIKILTYRNQLKPHQKKREIVDKEKRIEKTKQKKNYPRQVVTEQQKKLKAQRKKQEREIERKMKILQQSHFCVLSKPYEKKQSQKTEQILQINQQQEKKQQNEQEKSEREKFLSNKTIWEGSLNNKKKRIKRQKLEPKNSQLNANIQQSYHEDIEISEQVKRKRQRKVSEYKTKSIKKIEKCKQRQTESLDCQSDASQQMNQDSSENPKEIDHVICIGSKIRIDYKNGDFYFGGLQDEYFHGQGYYRSEKSGIYEGQFIRGALTGKGTFQHKGIQYEGMFKDWKRDGEGKEYYAQGEKYQGHYVDDYRQGYGVYYYKDGTRYEGQWKYDVNHGKGKQIQVDGSIYQGMWQHDEKHGEGIYKSKGKTWKQIWNNGILQSEEEVIDEIREVDEKMSE